MAKLCALCGRQEELYRGHIIPSYAFSWLKETSGTGYLRTGDKPNLRVQDGMVRELLCEDCEQRFSLAEKAFAETIFIPLNSGAKTPIEYESWMMTFVVSVCWRALHVLLAEGRLAEFPTNRVDEFGEALTVWAEFLRGERHDLATSEMHLLPIGLIKASSDGGLAPNLNRYLTRSVDLTVYADERTAFIYVKLPSVMFFGFTETLHSKHCRGSKLRVRRGSVGGSYVVPSTISDYLNKRARDMWATLESVSPRQRERMTSMVMKDRDRFASSGTFEAMIRDVEMFGDDAFAPKRPSDE